MVETIAGRANMIATHPLNIGPIGVTGSNSANAIAEQADVIVAVGNPIAGLYNRFLDSIRQGCTLHLNKCRAP